jgi:hypothetical protein
MRKLDRLGWVVEDWYRVGGTTVAVRSTSAIFAEWLRWALADHRRDEPDDEVQYPLFSVVLEDGSRNVGRVGRRFHILYHGTWDKVRTLDVSVLGRAVLDEFRRFLTYDASDLLYMRCALATSGDVTVLIPDALLPSLAKTGRRALRVGLIAPGHSFTALDPSTAKLVPLDTGLTVPQDAVQRLAAALPPDLSREDPHLFVDAPTRADVVLANVRVPLDPGTHPLTRSYTVTALAASALNLRSIGGRAIEAIGELVSRAGCYTVRWTTTEELLASLAALSPTTYVTTRSEATSEGP